MTTFTLAGGCFWCLDSIYRQLNGVISVESGYSNGKVKNPTYDTVCSGKTGYAEVVRITFDERTISSDTILEIFFAMHNPTTLNRQGNDVGTQYRSGLFFADASQKTVFEHARVQAQTAWDKPIVTEISPLQSYYLAEEYHQDYFNKNPANGYCNVVINPKLSKAREKFATYWKER